MALDPREQALREFAFSGRAGLSDLPSLLQKAQQPQTNQNLLLLGGQGGEGRARRGAPGINPLINVFGSSAAGGGGAVPAAAAGGSGAAQSAGQPFAPQFFGTGFEGGDTDAGDSFSGDPSVAFSDFDSFSAPRNIMNLMGFLSMNPFLGTGVADLFEQLGLGPFGVLGPERPEVGTELFRKTVEAGRKAGVANEIFNEPFLGSPTDPFAGPGGFGPDFGPTNTGLSEADELNEFGGGFGGRGGRGGRGGGGFGGGNDDFSGVGTGPGGDMGGGMLHAGGLISEMERPGMAQDVKKTLQEGEFVIRREAAQALGPAFLQRLNRAGTRSLASVMVPPRRPGGRR